MIGEEQMKILIVSPHPDDETLGAGGSLLRFKEEGHLLYWLIITNMKREFGYSEEQIQKRNEQIQETKQYYQFDDMLDLQLAPARLEEYDSGDIIGKIAGYMGKIQPEMVILPDFNDAHSDHKCVFNWCYACTKVFRHPYIKYILTMEIPSETDFGKPDNPFTPDLYFDITNYLDGKKKAMQIYETELGQHPFPRSLKSIEAFATVRGASAGVGYAEAFRIIKAIH